MIKPSLFVLIHKECNILSYREALYRILTTVLSRQLSQSQFTKLLERLGFNNKVVINYIEFFALFRKLNDDDSSFPKWMDPVQRTHLEKATMTADQVHLQLREKAKQRYCTIDECLFMPILIYTIHVASTCSKYM